MASSRLCSIPECSNPHQARGFCDQHYRRLLKNGDPTIARRPFIKAPCAAPGCTKDAECKGYCKSHYYRWQHHGDPLGGKAAQGEALRWLEAHVGHEGDECLIWPYRERQNGYGEVVLPDRRIAANRLMCTMAHGEPPDPSYDSAHSCGNGKNGCVHPKHLRWATRGENEMDKVAHGRSNRGDRHGMSKLATEDVLRIRSLKGIRTQHEIAEEYGIVRQTVSSIHRGTLWGWL